MVSWRKIRLGDICEIERGGSPRPIKDYITNRDDGVNWIKIGDTSSNSMYITSTKEKIIPEGVSKSRFVKSGDFLLTNSMSFGRPYILKVDGCIHDGWLVIRDEKNFFNKQFLYYLLSSDYMYSILKNMAVGGVVNNLNSQMVRNLELNVPTIDIQNKIAVVLEKAQELIDKRKAQIEALDELVKSKFIEMFGEPSKNEKNWEVAEIGNYLNVLTDYHSNGSYESLRDNVTLLDTPDYALMVRTTDLENNNFEKDVKYIDEHAYNHLEKSKVFGGEIIINKIGSAGKVYLMPFLNRPISLAMNQFLLRFDEEKVNHIFLYNLLLTPYMKTKIKEKVRGAVTKTITKDAIREIKIILPPIQIQREFVDFIKQVDKLKFEMQKSLTQLEDNFNSLIQKAFKGELFN
ncbi:MAG: restriction endonuclease subunit S [Clostridium lundense]|nr:restriction endonuclease subunit S [Clostridium lundense]